MSLAMVINDDPNKSTAQFALFASTTPMRPANINGYPLLEW
jgi:hypothetical protein